MNITVMIVDDAPFMRELLRHAIRRFGFQCIAEAKDGEEAIILAHQHNPDIILMDLVLPHKNGIEAIKEILETNPMAKIIAISTMNSEEIQIQAIQAGCVDFIAKPFDHEELKQAILAQFKRKEAAGG